MSALDVDDDPPAYRDVYAGATTGLGLGAVQGSNTFLAVAGAGLGGLLRPGLVDRRRHRGGDRFGFARWPR